METLDVRGLPERVTEALAETVQNLRQQFQRQKAQRPARLPTWPLGVKGTLRREEIYDHLDGKR